MKSSEGLLLQAATFKLDLSEFAHRCSGCLTIESFASTTTTGSRKRFQKCGGCKEFFYCSVEVRIARFALGEVEANQADA